MNRETASLILTSLRQRAEQASSPVVLTPVEIRALQVFFGESANQSESDVDWNDIHGASDAAPLEILGDPFRWRAEEVPSRDLILCLDFGTSFSKASVSKVEHVDDIPELIDIAFGQEGDGSTRYLLPSELFVYEASIYFGVAARRQFEIVEADQDQLIDSPKQYMTLGTQVAELHQKPLHPKQEPSQSLSQRDALVLYLSHLNYVAEKSLQDKDLTTNLLRRYAHPAWDDETARANSEEMNRIMAESIALTKLFSDKFEEKLPLSEAIKMLDKARQASDDDLPFDLLCDPVHEATAAGAGALMATRERHRRKRPV